MNIGKHIEEILVVRQRVGGVGVLRGGEASWQQMEENEWGLGAPCSPQ